MTDHKMEAAALLERADIHLGAEDFAHADLALKRAQVHATLALAEEQRTANILAYISNTLASNERTTPLPHAAAAWIERELTRVRESLGMPR